MNDRKRLSATPHVTCSALGPAVPEAARTDPVNATLTSHERQTR
jgi:hypothetical protein